MKSLRLPLTWTPEIGVALATILGLALAWRNLAFDITVTFCFVLTFHTMLTQRRRRGLLSVALRAADRISESPSMGELARVDLEEKLLRVVNGALLDGSGAPSSFKSARAAIGSLVSDPVGPTRGPILVGGGAHVPLPSRHAFSLAYILVRSIHVDAILGDIEERFPGVVERCGVKGAQAWVWSEVLRSSYPTIADGYCRFLRKAFIRAGSQFGVDLEPDHRNPGSRSK